MLLKVSTVNFKSSNLNSSQTSKNKDRSENISKEKSSDEQGTKLLGSQYADSLQALNGIATKGDVYFSAPNEVDNQDKKVAPGEYIVPVREPKVVYNINDYKTNVHLIPFDEFYIPPHLSESQSVVVGDDELRIPNVLEHKDGFEFPANALPYHQSYLNPNGLNVVKTDKDNAEIFKVQDDHGRVLFVGKFDKNIKDRPIITYKQGKYQPEITVKDKSLKGTVIKMFEGSEIIGDGFELKMPGEYQTSPGASVRDVTFTGNKNNLFVTTMYMEPKTREGVEKYLDAELSKDAIEGDYADIVREKKPVGTLPAGGHGTRLLNITRKNENKPSSLLPTDENYRMVASALNSMASAGMLDDLASEDVVYVSQSGDIEGDNVYYSQKYKTDGGAIAEALMRNIIPNERDGVILNADILTNADISRTYYKLATLPDAGLIIPYYPVDGQRAKSFGLLGVEVDENGNSQIKSFIEKPKYTTTPPSMNDFHDGDDFEEAIKIYAKSKAALCPGTTDTYMANPGMYFFSPEVAKVIMMQNMLEPDKTGLGKDIMPKVIDLINQGKLINKAGNPVKAYTVPLEAKGGKPAVWDDIGTAEAYLKLIKDAAHEVKLHGTGEDNKYYGVPKKVLADFANNTDLENGIVYLSEKSRNSFDDFKEKYGVKTARGNIFVTAGGTN